MTRIKICGIRRTEDALLAVELGANALGFVFWPSSPRVIEPDRALPIVNELPPFVTTVGVFVNERWDTVVSIARRLGLGAVQLHGDEPPDSYARSEYRVIKALSVSSSDESLAQRAAVVPASATVLLDAHDPIKRGGTGQTIDWRQAVAISKVRPVILSGGLSPDNVASAIEAVHPYAIDVSSGVEASPGVKDAAKLRALFAAVASADADREHRTVKQTL